MLITTHPMTQYYITEFIIFSNSTMRISNLDWNLKYSALL